MKRPLSRWLYHRFWVQLATAVLANSWFLSRFKGLCYPGLNCWACPTANFACPIGALQNAAAGSRLALAGGAGLWAVIPLYTLGTLLLIGALFGRMVCGWLCPFGWVQELIGRTRRKLSVPRPLTYLRYGVLISLVFIIPYLTGEAWFSKLCPMGALQGSIPQPLLYPELRSQIGTFWVLKLVILAVTLIAAYFVRRPFCGAICPLGAIYSLFHRVSAWRLDFDRDQCVDCLQCVRQCPQGLDPRRDLNSHACIGCLECRKCPYGAITSQPMWKAPAPGVINCAGCGQKQD